MANLNPLQQDPVNSAGDEDLPPMGPPIATGLYRHYKGGHYELVGVVRHSESLQEMVLYRALYGAHGLWVRAREMFEGTVEIDGVCVPRFARVADADGRTSPPA